MDDLSHSGPHQVEINLALKTLVDDESVTKLWNTFPVVDCSETCGLFLFLRQWHLLGAGEVCDEVTHFLVLER